MDLGVNSGKAAEVEQWFDDLTTWDERVALATPGFSSYVRRTLMCAMSFLALVSVAMPNVSFFLTARSLDISACTGQRLGPVASGQVLSNLYK